MYGFSTRSGSIYTVADGRITRQADTEVGGLCPSEAVDRMSFEALDGPPKAGRSFVFRRKGGGPIIRTSPVERILPVFSADPKNGEFRCHPYPDHEDGDSDLGQASDLTWEPWTEDDDDET